MNLSQNLSKKKILIDLDVITIAKWEKQDQRKEQAVKFLQKAENKEFELMLPLILLEQIFLWKYEELRIRIESFYIGNCSQTLSSIQLMEKLLENPSYLDLYKRLLDINIKEEDALLLVSAIILDCDYFVTLNRRHLHSNKEKIYEIIKKSGFKALEIVYPDYFSAPISTAFSFLFLYFSNSLKNLVDIPFLISSANLIGSTFTGMRASSPSFFTPFLFSMNISNQKPYKYLSVLI